MSKLASLSAAISALNSTELRGQGYRVALEHVGASTDALVEQLTGGADEPWAHRMVTDASPHDLTADLEALMRDVTPHARASFADIARAAAAHFDSADYDGLVYFSGWACGAQHWVLVGKRADGEVDALVVRALL